MNPKPWMHRVIWAAFFALGLSASAQNALYVEADGKGHLVRRVEHRMPFYEDESGKFVPVARPRYSLQPAPEYAPMFVSVRNVHAASHHVEAADTGDEFNHRFEFRGEFESPYGLTNVFIVLDLNTTEAGHVIFVREIGELRPRQPLPLAVMVPVSEGVGEGRFNLHVFADGVEVFQSQMPRAYIERTLDKMVRKRIAGAPDGPPRPFVGPAPEYPAALRRAKTTGKAVIRFSISATGRVLDPQVKSATDPAFGEAALAAAQLWRFLPKIKDGAPVVTTAEFPFSFDPGAPAGRKQ